MRPIIGVNCLWGRMSPPCIPFCPQEPWEAQEDAHRDRSRVGVGSKFRFVSDLSRSPHLVSRAYSTATLACGNPRKVTQVIRADSRSKNA